MSKRPDVKVGTPRVERLRDVMNTIDVMRLIKLGCPRDEYDAEIQMLEEKLLPGSTAPDVAILLNDIFDKMFWEGAGDRSKFGELSREVLRVWEEPLS
jgi:hypothetical protein